MKKMLTSFTVVCMIFSGLVLFPALTSATIQQTYYVSPSGSDSNPGTISQPFLTVAKARDVVRTVNGNMTGDIVVYLRGGTYNITSPIALDASDSGTNGYNVIYQAYPNETPIISGGTTITGWTLHDAAKGIYKASVSASLDTRHLYVDGVRKVRARGEDHPSGFGRTSGGYTLPSTGKYSNMASWSNIGDIQVYTKYAWVNDFVTVSTISGNVMTMADTGWSYSQSDTIADLPTRIENAYELLDEENEWYLDKSANYIYYKPTVAEGDLSTVTVTAPTVETLLSGTGTLGDPIHHIQFDGITFMYNTWLAPNGTAGYPAAQGGTIRVGPEGNFDNETVPGAVSFHYAHYVEINHCTFIHLGNVGLDIGRGSQNNKVDYNTFTDISGIALQLGRIDTDIDHHPSDGRIIVKDNILSNNLIHGTGVEYEDSVGLLVGYTDGSIVDHNTLYDLPYSAINVGWGWGDADQTGTPVAGNNVISHNRIYDYLKVMYDGGGIYTLGSQKNTLIYNNYLSGQKNSLNYIYLDNGTQAINVAKNVVDTTSGIAVYWYHSAYYYDPVYLTYDTISRYNYYSSNLSVLHNPQTVTVDTNIPVSNNYWPTDAIAIMANAGVGGGQGPDPLFAELNTNLALNRAATASNHYVYAPEPTYYAASKAVDGNTSTRWATDYGVTASTLEVDFGEDTSFDTVTISEFGEIANWIAGYKIQYYDGTNWGDAYTGTRIGPFDVIHFPQVTGSKVRLQITSSDINGSTISEFGVYNTTSDPIINNIHPDIHYDGFMLNSKRSAFNDYKYDVHMATANNSSFEYTFNGTGIDYIAPKDTAQGEVEIFVDAVSQGTFSAYASSYASQQLIFSETGLSPGQHTIKVVKKNGTYAMLDFLRVHQSPIDNDTIANISYSGFSYSNNRNAGDFLNDVHYATANGSSAEYTFYGTGITYLSPMNSDYGTADIYIDGVFQQSVDTSSANYLAQQSIYSNQGLTQGYHTIKVVKTGGDYVCIDAFKVD